MNAAIAAPAEIKKGLEGVLADVTSISDVDGAAGRLLYRGYTVESLTQHRFADVAHLIVFGELPNAARSAQFEAHLWQAGRLPRSVVSLIESIARTNAHPMVILQSIAPLLSEDALNLEFGRGSEEEHGVIVAARLPAVIGLVQALRQNRPFDYPDAQRYGERYLQLLTGHPPSPTSVDVFEQTQVLQLDHSFNASTFAARVVTSTLAPPASAIAAALGALYGPLHGRADQEALAMAEQVASPDNARRYIAHCLANKIKVMGMGHREYRVVDPRANIIKQLAERIVTSTEHRRLLATLVAIEEEFTKQHTARRTLRANLEFYKGVVYLALGIPKDCFTASFAAARAFGWAAHIVEQRQNNRLIRPGARYIGPTSRQQPSSS